MGHSLFLVGYSIIFVFDWFFKMTETAIIAIAIGLAVFLVAYFSGIEVAFNSANRLNIELKKKQGRSSGIFLSHLFDNPSRFVGVHTVGFTFFLVITILLGPSFLRLFKNDNAILQSTNCVRRGKVKGIRVATSEFSYVPFLSSYHSHWSPQTRSRRW